MSVHDWTRVDAGLFHNFHQTWSVHLCNALNAGGLPADYFALLEQRIHGPIPDVLALKIAPDAGDKGGPAGDMPGRSAGLAVAESPPRTRMVRRRKADVYAEKANRLTVRHRHGDVVSVVEIVSPGNKASRAELRAFVQKAVELIRAGIHVLIVDLFPPGPRDPQGLHTLIWNEFDDQDFGMASDRPLVLASYDAGPPQVAYVETVGVGEELPAMPLFLRPEYYVETPLEASYQEAWLAFPAVLKKLLA